jgi:hypothetical protein
VTTPGDELAQIVRQHVQATCPPEIQEQVTRATVGAILTLMNEPKFFYNLTPVRAMVQEIERLRSTLAFVKPAPRKRAPRKTATKTASKKAFQQGFQERRR